MEGVPLLTFPERAGDTVGKAGGSDPRTTTCVQFAAFWSTANPIIAKSGKYKM